MVTLTKAHDQWANRPADQRFGSLSDMLRIATVDKTTATVEAIKANALKAIEVDAGVSILLPGSKTPMPTTNWAFSQLANIAKAPASYLRTLPAKLAAECINDGLAKHADADDEGGHRQLLFSGNKVPMARALTSDKYGRVWNSDLIERLVELEAKGPWQPAPEAFDGSRGLYLGDRDMFAFMVDNERRIFERGPGGGLGRGFFLRNNEVGNGAFDITTFWYEYVCGNHRVWGAQKVEETRVIHIGGERFERVVETMQRELIAYSNASAKDDEAKVLTLRRREIGKDRDAVVDTIAKLKIAGLGKNTIGSAFDLAAQRVDWYGAPTTAWGFTGGLTELARDLPNGDKRTELDQAAGQVMDLMAA